MTYPSTTVFPPFLNRNRSVKDGSQFFLCDGAGKEKITEGFASPFTVSDEVFFGREGVETVVEGDGVVDDGDADEDPMRAAEVNWSKCDCVCGQCFQLCLQAL